MSAPKDVWTKFFWSDWRGDEALALCSFAARGVWMEFLALMAKSNRKGYLLVNGQPPNDRDLLVLVRGRSMSELKKAIKELKTCGVCSVGTDGILFSRRMVRDAARRETNRMNGRLGGNPRLVSVNRKDNHSVNLTSNRADNPQKPEARSQKPEKIVGRSAPAPTTALLTKFDALHQGKTGDRAVIRGGKDGKLLADLCRTHGPERVEALMRQFFASDDPFIRQAGYTVGVFVSQAGKLMVRERAPTLREPTYDMDWWEECKAKHGGQCNGRLAHANQMEIDAERAAGGT